MHGAAAARYEKHVFVIQAVSEGDAFGNIQAQLPAQGAQGVSLSGAGAVDFDVVAQRRGGDQLGKQLRHQGKLACALVHVLRPEVHLKLFQRNLILQDLLFQVRDRAAQALDQLQDMRLGLKKVRRLFVHPRRHVPAVPPIAVIEHRETVHIRAEPNRELRLDPGPVKRPIFLQVIDQRAVCKDEIAKQLKLQKLLRKRLQDPPRGGHQENAPVVRRPQRGKILFRQVLVIVQKGSVQVKRDQFYSHSLPPSMCIQVYLNIVTHLLLHSVLICCIIIQHFNKTRKIQEVTKMKKILAVLLAIAMICAFGVTAFADDAVAPKDGGSKVTFTTGGEAGTYYGFGSVLAQKVSDVTSTNVTAITSGGSAANIDAIDIGDAQLGFSQSDVLAYAYAGERTFEEIGAIDSFSIVAPLYMEQVQIVTLNPDIKTVADLKGKSVSIGAAGSGVYFNAIDVLGAYGLTEDDIKPTYQSFGDSAEALQDGQIDAAFVVAGAPTTAITSLAASKSVYLVSLDDEHIDALIEASPFYSKAVIPADTYGMPEDATTVAVSAVVIASNDVADVDVYNFLCGVYENLDDLAKVHDKANELSLEFASSFVGVPYHAGAVQYFADKGIEVPAE